MPEPPAEGLTFEKVWAMFQETDRILKAHTQEIALIQKETAQQQQETDRQLQETGKRLDRLANNVDFLTRSTDFHGLRTFGSPRITGSLSLAIRGPLRDTPQGKDLLNPIEDLISPSYPYLRNEMSKYIEPKVRGQY